MGNGQNTQRRNESLSLYGWRYFNNTVISLPQTNISKAVNCTLLRYKKKQLYVNFKLE